MFIQKNKNEEEVIDTSIKKIYDGYELANKIKAVELYKIRDEIDKNIEYILEKQYTSDKLAVSQNDLEFTAKFKYIEDAENYLYYGWDVWYKILNCISAKKKYKISEIESKYGNLDNLNNLEVFLIDTYLIKSKIFIDIKYIKKVVAEGVKLKQFNKKIISILKKSKNKTKTLQGIQTKIIIESFVNKKNKHVYNDLNKFCKVCAYLNELVTDDERFKEFVADAPVDYLEDIFNFIKKYRDEISENCDMNKIVIIEEQINSIINKNTKVVL